MRLTTLTDYAMRLLMYVGQHPERLCTISEIAHAYGISEPHLMKITHRLGQQGWIETVRGKNGGMRLALAPKDINLGAVLRDTENDLELVECFGSGNTCSLSGRCRLTAIIDGALQQFLRHLDHYSLADILPDADQEPVHRRSDERPLTLVRSIAQGRSSQS
ncbi:Rrf2 family transcriptional regulator [Paralcaligenes sp. KSB-10]|jgi:Rrf2 family nitric oxide-sensitive transcriptional repressor|uniref:RrF2 family transcriptional regulator n=1 Tax=Paralcaligenes sp. KSB-10 TaxID=2901142 RepID=UPI001E653B4C|nr:Rrf2 family transcriptional regulator [Paralcaligenes sp. KSB-10]UHL62657.1 Rrf2 family transcriptional regulator [Paralcaligenes sp. KSB-10]